LINTLFRNGTGRIIPACFSLTKCAALCEKQNVVLCAFFYSRMSVAIKILKPMFDLSNSEFFRFLLLKNILSLCFLNQFVDYLLISQAWLESSILSGSTRFFMRSRRVLLLPDFYFAIRDKP